MGCPVRALRWETRVVELYKLGERGDGALARADEALARQADRPDGGANWHARALALLGLKRLPKTLEAIDRAVTLLPDDWLPARTKATILAVQGRFAEGMHWVIRAQRLKRRERRRTRQRRTREG
jgi:hypothetical protein